MLAAIGRSSLKALEPKVPVVRHERSAPGEILHLDTKRLGRIEHSFTRLYRPQTNGKAERFIQACLREWAYARSYAHSAGRASWLPAFIADYNSQRPRSALGYKPPASRLGGNNLLQLNG